LGILMTKRMVFTKTHSSKMAPITLRNVAVIQKYLARSIHESTVVLDV
jgi:hypothetical protein